MSEDFCSKPRTEVSDFAGVLLPLNGGQPPVIVGGHAVNLWSMYYLSKGITELAAFLPFTSKDLDLVGTLDLLERLHWELKGVLTRSAPRSPVLGRLEIPSKTGELLRIEVLHIVKGLDFKELSRTIDLRTGDVFGRVLLPHLVLKAKIENAISIDQMERNDVKHVSMMILCVRSFVSELAAQVANSKLGERSLVNFLGEVWEIVASKHAEKAATLWNFDFRGVWPMEELKTSGGEKVARWLEHRLV
jgi:hypothetical protein